MRGIVDRVGSSFAHLSLYVGLDRTAKDLQLGTTNLWVFPGPDHDANVAAFEADPEAPFPTVYISFPSAKDPDFERRHPGHATIEALTMAPFDWFAPWTETRWHKRGPEYDALKRGLADRLLEHVYAQVPATRGHVIHAELSTPLSTRHFSNYEHGEIYGLRSSPARFLERGLGPRTAVRGLYLTGQDAVAIGITGALMSGVVSASLVLGRNLMGEAVKH
jgi:all-trans-retinol 13,14-reductase